MGTLDELTRQETTVEIRAAGLTAELVAGLAQWGQMPGTAGHAVADYKSQMTDTVVSVVITVADEEFLPQIAAYLLQGGARLYSLAPQRVSLEELFMRVMAEER